VTVTGTAVAGFDVTVVAGDAVTVEAGVSVTVAATVVVALGVVVAGTGWAALAPGTQETAVTISTRLRSSDTPLVPQRK
jgi:hypothetical protein